MGLSGDIYDLTDAHWKLIDDAIAFYKEAAPIIKDGYTFFNHADTRSYNNPTGSQLVLRVFGDRVLCVYHRFKNSVNLASFAKENRIDIASHKVLRKYGNACEDFSAEAYIFEK